MKALIAIPLVFSTAAFVLSLLSLLAGYKQGFMEDYNLLTLNTSALGQQAIQRIANGESPTPTTGDSGAIGDIIASATALIPTAFASEAAVLIGQIGGSVADQLSEELGISEFYSIHAMDFCQGKFEPNATSPGAWHNVTNCSTPLDFGAYNFTDKINQELSVGPFQFTLAQLGVSQEVQDTLDLFPMAARALAALFIVSVFFAGLSVLLSALGLIVLPRLGRTLAFLNWLYALLAAVFLLASALVATIGPRVAADQLKQQGADVIGLGVISSTKLQSITWAAFGSTVLSTLYWFYELIVQCCGRRKGNRPLENIDSYIK